MTLWDIFTELINDGTGAELELEPELEIEPELEVDIKILVY